MTSHGRGARLILGHVVEVAPKLAIDRRRRPFQLHAALADLAMKLCRTCAALPLWVVHFRIELDGYVGETTSGERCAARNTTESGGQSHGRSVE